MRPYFPVLLTAFFAACATTSTDRAILYDGMGTYQVRVSTKDPQAQRYFDQGLALCHGFNHDEAARSFEEAARIDPDCAMAYWGIAYALGPNFNLWDEGDAYAARASAALETARRLAPSVTALERDLIAALSRRFATPRPKDRAQLNQAYAEAMAALWRKHVDHAEVGFLYADALLNLNPWDQWNVDGTPKHHTPTIMAVLERVLTVNVNHPGANHLYIHTMEASHTPEKAGAAADRLGGLMPGVGHMVHMPAHIYMRIGRYDDSTRVNQRACELDREFFERTGTTQSNGIYHLYHLHNHHFMIWSAMFQGRYEDAIRQCDELFEDWPTALREHAFYEDWHTTKLHVNLRFGKWDEILKAKAPPKGLHYATAIWHYARGIALANTGHIAEAKKEATAFEAAAGQVAEDMFIHVVPGRDVLKVARHMLAGETAYKAGNAAAGIASLEKAVEAETALRYTEPNPWMMPTRHALGALLLEQGKVAEAEQCYRDDLKRYPGNGWALHGLAECLQRKGSAVEATATKSRFDKAWANATVKITASCFCRTK
jgi:tetratricopeptide (TPR) repeat protein